MGSLTERLSGATPGSQARQAPARATAATSTPQTSGPRRWVVIESDLFPGEDVLCVLDPAALQEAQAAEPGLVTYTMAEIDLLYPIRKQRERIQALHRVKKKFGGWIREITGGNDGESA